MGMPLLQITEETVDVFGLFQLNLLMLAGGVLLVLVIVVVLVVLMRRSPPLGEPEAVEPGEEPQPSGSTTDPGNDPPEAHASPRRAVTVPANESDNRQSEQTLKRMTVEQLEDSGVIQSKGPRASEVEGNPILPDDEEVKIRCVECDRKMKALGAKFAKQRRCPNCKKAPFRYKLEPQPR